MRRKLVRLLFSVGLIAAIINPAVFAEGDVNIGQINFVDVHQDYWANDAVTNLAKSGVIQGYPDNTFRPENQVSREEFAALVAKTFYLNLPSASAKATFFDVQPDRWSFPYVEAAKDFLTGYFPPSGKNYFNPEMNATREDVAVTLVKALGYTADDLQDPNILDRSFSDVVSISPNLKTYVALAVEKQLFSGYPDYTFRGDKPVSRAEVATLLFKIIKSAATDGNADISLTVNVPEKTSDGTVYVSGTTNKGATVTINDKPVDVVQGKFNQGYKIETEGSYSIVVVSRITGGKTKTVTKQITYEKGGPVLRVNDIPAQSDKQSITVSWSVKDDNDYNPKVYINDQLQSTWSESATIDLSEGTNTLVFKAVNNLGKSTTVTKTVMFNGGGPVLKVDDIPDTTDKQSVTVSWNVTDKNDSYPKVYINDEAQFSWQTSKSISLNEGVNTIVFKATNSLGKLTTITKTISLSSGAPTLKIGEIPSSTDSEKLNVSWSVSDKNDSYPKVYINDVEYFSWQTSASLTLEPGENTIRFKAVNSSGKVSAVSKTITFNPPAPKLTIGYIPDTTSSSSISLTWTVNDKNDSYPKVYINDELQSSWQSSKTVNLNKGGNQIIFLATNKYGKQSTVTDTVYKN